MAPMNERQPLVNYLKVQDKTDREMLRLLRQMDADITSQLRTLVLRSGVGATIRRSQLQGVQREIRGTLSEFYEQTGRVVQAGRARASEAAVSSMFEYGDVLKRAGFSASEVQVMRRSAAQTAKSGLSHMMARHTSSRLPLSQQVYKTKAFTNGLLDRKVQSAIGRGLSAREFATEIKGFVNPKTRGGVQYASMRLARTELNNAFHASTISAAAEQDWVTGVQWNLSKSHPKPDECDQYAAHKPYDPLDVPSKPHPHCLCYMTFEIMDDDAFVRLVKSGRYD